MILVDFNQIAIGSVMVSLHRGEELSEQLVHHIILNQLRYYRQKFHDEYGELVICCDSKHYWRRDYFPHYKAARKKIVRHLDKIGILSLIAYMVLEMT